MGVEISIQDAQYSYMYPKDVHISFSSLWSSTIPNTSKCGLSSGWPKSAARPGEQQRPRPPQLKAFSHLRFVPCAWFAVRRLTTLVQSPNNFDLFSATSAHRHSSRHGPRLRLLPGPAGKHHGLDRYNPETTPVFQDYVAQQCENQTYDAYANLALLKL